MPKVWISSRQDKFLDLFIDRFLDETGLELTFSEALNFFLCDESNREVVKRCVEKVRADNIFGSGKEGLQ